MASAMGCPCETRTSTCRSFATISSGLYRFLAIAVLLDVKDIPQVGPLQWGWIMIDHSIKISHCAARRLNLANNRIASSCDTWRPIEIGWRRLVDLSASPSRLACPITQLPLLGIQPQAR